MVPTQDQSVARGGHGATLPLSPVQAGLAPSTRARYAQAHALTVQLGESPPRSTPTAQAKTPSGVRSRGLSASPAPAPRAPPASSPSHLQAQDQTRRHRHRHEHRARGSTVVAWVPDSLAEKCYQCQAYFSLVLRRHHCRRCGNVFCDACSSARIPLVGSGFLTPVRVCGKCLVAAKKAHAKMVHERHREQQQQFQPRRHSDNGHGSGRESAASEATTVGATNGFFSSSDGPRDRHLHVKNWESQSVMLSPFTAAGESTPGRNFSRAPSGPYDDGMQSSRELLGSGAILTSNARRQMPVISTFSHPPSGMYERERGASEDTVSDYGGPANSGFLHMLAGEAVLVRSDNVRVRFLERIEHVGTLYVTNYRLVFSPYTIPPDTATGKRIPRVSTDLSVNVKRGVREDELPYASDLRTEAVAAYQAIPLVSIDRVKRKEMVETDSGLLEVVGKDFRHVQFLFDGLVSKQTFSLFDRTFSLVRLHALGEPEGKVDEFAKFSMERFDTATVDGWQIYDPVAEFQRMGVSSSSRWRLSHSNDKYELCPTYPSLLAVPTSVSDSVLLVASKFRSKGRIPVLSWRDTQTGAVICRSSQPLVGLGQKQCDKDVFLIQAIAATNPSSSKLVIIDARPWKNAVAQKTVGRAGYELTEHYETRHATASLKYADMVASEQTAAAAAAAASNSLASPSTSTTMGSSINGEPVQPSSSTGGGDSEEDDGRRQILETIESSLVLTECKLIFMGIENIHTMRRSYHRLMDLCTTKQSNDKWLDQLASTHWLNHISRILDSAVEIVRIVKEQKSSVLIHCSDGWDRTAQLTALTELLIDPYYRTIRGFEVLIEKEWCSFGHKFRDRTGHGASNGSSETSPVFLQWIDCVWQVLTQFPSAFEFNERYLILILDHLYSCRFGTFLYDSQRERVQQEAVHPTQSLWTFLSTVDRAMVLNPFYQPADAPRMQWKASVTATRQCFERAPGDEYDEEVPMVPLVGRADCEVNSIVDEIHDYRKTRRVFVPSDSSSLCSSPSSVTRRSPLTELSSPLSPPSQDGATDKDLDEAIESTHVELLKELQRARDGNNDSPFDANDCDSSEDEEARHLLLQQPSCFHKLVRDLDSGFSFPQPLEASALGALCSSPPVIQRPRPMQPTRRSEGGNVASVGKPATPTSRPSLTSLFTPTADRPPGSSDSAWNTSEADVASEGDETSRYGALASFEDVIVPSCSMKALRLWSHYYLRWDPTSNCDRDASVEIEAVHRDLLLRLKAMTNRVNSIQENEAIKWERRFQRFLYGRQHGGGGSSTSSLSPLSKPQGAGARALSDGSTSSQDSVLSSQDMVPGETLRSVMVAKTLDERIALLQEQKQRRVAEAEAKYQEQIERLLSGNLPAPNRAERAGSSSSGVTRRG